MTYRRIKKEKTLPQEPLEFSRFAVQAAIMSKKESGNSVSLTLQLPPAAELCNIIVESRAPLNVVYEGEEKKIDNF